MAQKKEKNAVVVPKEEQPYEVPENWLWVRLGGLCTIYRGVSYKKNEAHSEKMENDCLILRGGNIGEGFIEVNTDNVYVSNELVNDEQIVKLNDVIIVASTGSKKVIGRAGISSQNYFDVAFGAFLMLIRPNEIALPRLVGYYFQSDLYRNRIRTLATGVNINNIRAEYIINSAFPLPPLPEQQRIVNIIESLFKDLDEAKEKLSKVKKGFGERKAALLHKAFTGELTAKWRERNGVGLESWENVQLGELTDIQSSKRVYKEDYVEEGIPFFRSSEVVELYDKGTVEPKFFISYEKYNQLKENYGVPQIGDMLVTSVGTIGKTWIVDERQFYYKDGNLTQVVKNDKFLMQYLQKYMQSGEFQSQVNSTVAGSAYNALTIVKFKNLIVLLPTLPEQKEIVSILDAVLSAEKEAEQKVDSVIEGIDLFKKYT